MRRYENIRNKQTQPRRQKKENAVTEQKKMYKVEADNLKI